MRSLPLKSYVNAEVGLSHLVTHGHATSELLTILNWLVPRAHGECVQVVERERRIDITMREAHDHDHES